jgi:hypothetical protein
MKASIRFKKYDKTMVDLYQVAAIKERCEATVDDGFYYTHLLLKGGGEIVLQGKSDSYIADWQVYIDEAATAAEMEPGFEGYESADGNADAATMSACAAR